MYDKARRKAPLCLANFLIAKGIEIDVSFINPPLIWENSRKYSGSGLSVGGEPIFVVNVVSESFILS